MSILFGVCRTSGRPLICAWSLSSFTIDSVCWNCARHKPPPPSPFQESKSDSRPISQLAALARAAAGAVPNSVTADGDYYGHGAVDFHCWSSVISPSVGHVCRREKTTKQSWQPTPRGTLRKHSVVCLCCCIHCLAIPGRRKRKFKRVQDCTSIAA